MLFHRQKLILVNVLKTPPESIRGDYSVRGSLQYEFDTELLQTPVQLLKTTSLVPQVSRIGLLTTSTSQHRINDKYGECDCFW